jgi:hypothetical protein
MAEFSGVRAYTPVGNVETKTGGRQVFGSVAKAGTDIEGLIRKNLDAVGGTGDIALTAFTDGCPGLRGILANAGVLEPPILDWFHIAMRLQHLKQIGDGLTAGDPARGREGGDRGRGRAIALADLEWKSEERGEKHRPYPRSDASFPGRTGQPEIDRAVAKTLDGLAGAEQVFDRPERVAATDCGFPALPGLRARPIRRRLRNCLLEAMALSREQEFYRSVGMRNHGANRAVKIRHRMPGLR